MLGRNFYAKNAANKWWDQYRNQDNVLIEDMDKSHTYQGFYLKIWADKYAYPVEIKTSGDLIRPKVIIVTSNYSIEEVFPDPSIHLPLLERFKVIHKTQPWNATVNTALKKSKLPKKSKKIGLVKKRKFDQALKKPALYRQAANGMIVENNVIQPVIEESLALREAQEIAREKEVLEIMDSDDEHDALINHELCFLCGEEYDGCSCMDSENDICTQRYDGEYVPDSFSSYDENDDISEDLFDC